MLSPPAFGVVPQAGDFIQILQGCLRYIDAETGEETIVSTWREDTACGPILGAGVTDVSSLSGGPPVVGLDAFFYVALFDSASPFDSSGICRIDPQNGNRELIAGGDYSSGAFTIYPSPTFFPPTVASLGTWGLAALLAGVFIGVQLRIRNAAKV